MNLDTETIVAMAGAALGTGGIGGVLTYLGIRAKAAASDRRASATERKAALEHDGRIAPQLIERLDKLEQQREEDRAARERERVEDREQCDEEIARKVAEVEARHDQSVRVLADEIKRLARARAADEGRDDEPTGVHRLEEGLARARSSPSLPALPPPPERES